MKFLADMGVSMSVVSWLRGRGHDVVHVRELEMHLSPDEEIFQKAALDSRIVITFDLDFGELLSISHDEIVSVLLFRLRNTRSQNVAQRLEDTLEHAASALREGAIVIVEDNRYRVRRLPIGR